MGERRQLPAVAGTAGGARRRSRKGRRRGTGEERREGIGEDEATEEIGLWRLGFLPRCKKRTAEIVSGRRSNGRSLFARLF